MQSFDSDGVRIAYIDEGEGEPILLIHGFASNVAANWRDAHWVRALTEAGAASSPTTIAGTGEARSSTTRAFMARRSWPKTRAACSTTSASPAPT